MKTSLHFPIPNDTEPKAFGYGYIPSKHMIIIPEAPLGLNGIYPTTPKQMSFFGNYIKTFLRQAYLTPLVKHRRDATAKTLYARDIRYWLPILFREIEIVRPERILVMGKFASKHLIPNFKRMDQDHGALFPVEPKDIDPSLRHLTEKIILVPTFSLQDVFRDPMAQAYFNNDLKRFAQTPLTEPEWTVCDDIGQIPLPIDKTITIDTETDGLEITSRVTMIGIGYEPNHLFIAHDPTPEQITLLFQRLNQANCHLNFHNTTFDLAQLMTSSDNKMPMPVNRVEDSMVRAHLSGIHVRNLKHLTSMYTDLPGPHSGGGTEDEQYLAEDVRSTMALRKVTSLSLADGTYADHLYHDLAPIFVKMRLRGVYMNRDKLLDLLVTSEQTLAQDSATLNGFVPKDMGEINWNSTQQVVELMKRLEVPLTTQTKTGNLSVAEAVLEELLVDLTEYNGHFEDQMVMIKALLKFRTSSKLVSGFLRSYLDLLDDLNLLYPYLKLLGTRTGRLSCADPNLQQIPREGDFKLCFEPRWENGYYGLVDFAGAELRMAAIVSGDKQMAEFILSGDPHSFMARLAFPDIIPENATIKEIKNDYAAYRKASKSTTFGKMYGGSNKGIAHTNSLPVENVAAVETALRRVAPDLMNWLDMVKERSIKTLYTDTIFGNKRHLLDKKLYEGDWAVGSAGTNTPIQGASGILALIVLRRMHQLCEEWNLKSRPIFGVHDSVLSEIAEDEVDIYGQLVQEAYRDIENSPIVDYPVYHMLGIQGDLEIGKTWAHTESTNEHFDLLKSIPCDSRFIPE